MPVDFVSTKSLTVPEETMDASHPRDWSADTMSAGVSSGMLFRYAKEKDSFYAI
jgi:hypothetical protein